MATVDILDTADLRLFYGNATKIVNLVTPAPFLSLTVAGRGETAAFSPVGRSHPEVIPVSASTMVAARGLGGDALRSVAGIQADAVLVVILSASGVGWVVPSRVWDTPGIESDTQLSSTDVVRTSVSWEPTGQSRIITSVYDVVDRTAITVPALATGAEVWLVLTTAGLVGTKAFQVGVHRTTIGAGTAPVARAGGYLLVTRPHTAGGVG